MATKSNYFSLALANPCLNYLKAGLGCDLDTSDVNDQMTSGLIDVDVNSGKGSLAIIGAFE